MLSKEKLADIIKDEIENEIRKGETLKDYYFILLNGEIYQADRYDYEVAEGKRSANDIYALVGVWTSPDFDTFLLHINYLEISSVNDIVKAYLRKVGFTIEYYVDLHPTPNLKYFIRAEVELNNDTPKYLVIDIYDIDTLARTFRIPQIVQQKLGNKPRKITSDDTFNIKWIVANEQPLLAGHTYDNAYGILLDYYILHEKKYKDKANKIDLAYLQLFPTPYRVCYEWKARRFDKIDCLKITLHSFSS